MSTRNAYRYNPDCTCEVCTNHGHVPAGHPESGHSIGFGNPHYPPTNAAPPNPGPVDKIAPATR